MPIKGFDVPTYRPSVRALPGCEYSSAPPQRPTAPSPALPAETIPLSHHYSLSRAPLVLTIRTLFIPEVALGGHDS